MTPDSDNWKVHLVVTIDTDSGDCGKQQLTTVDNWQLATIDNNWKLAVMTDNDTW